MSRGDRRGPVLLLVVLLAGAALWWVARDGRPRAEPGQVIRPSGSQVEADGRTVAIPWGKLLVKVGVPVSELPPRSSGAHKKADVRAPRGGRFVGVSVTMDAESLLQMPQTEGSKYLEPEIVLVADDRRYPIDGLVPLAKPPQVFNLGERTRYVAVAGAAKSRRLEISYDGERRVVQLTGGQDEPGRFASLDDSRDYRKKSCGKAAWPRPFSAKGLQPDDCQITWAQRLPYVAGLGWAPAGKAWLTVNHAWGRPWGFDWRSTSGQQAEYLVNKDLSRTRYTLDGRPPAAVIDLAIVGGRKIHQSPEQTQLIFAVDVSGGPQPLTIRQELHTWQHRADVSSAPKSPVVPVTWRVAVP